MPQFVGLKLGSIRRARGLSQGELAQQVGLASRDHLAKVEGGEDPPSLELVVRLANVLNIGMEYLLRDDIGNVGGTTALAQWQKHDMRDVRQFASRLRQLREQQHLTQFQVSQQLGLARQGYISNLETGRKLPSLDLLVQVARLFDVSVDDLLSATTM
jgi:transcriptional regulator with XRE-family HTH domain